MTRELECIVEGWSATIEGATDDEILQQAAEHAAREHPDLELDDGLVDGLRSNIVTV